MEFVELVLFVFEHSRCIKLVLFISSFRIVSEDKEISQAPLSYTFVVTLQEETLNIVRLSRVPTSHEL